MSCRCLPNADTAFQVDKHNDALAALETFKREQAERDKRWLKDQAARDQKQKTRDVHRDKQFAIVRDELADLKLRLLEAEALKRGLLGALPARIL